MRAREVLLLGEPMAASIGAGLPIHDEYANMIVDIGGSTTEVAIIFNFRSFLSKKYKGWGDELDEAIVAYMKRAYGLLIGERTAEEIKFSIGSASPLDSGELSMDAEVEIQLLVYLKPSTSLHKRFEKKLSKKLYNKSLIWLKTLWIVANPNIPQT